MQGSLTIEQMCRSGHVSRASFYRSLKETLPGEEGIEVRSEVQKIVLQHRRRNGYRRVTAELRRRGMVVNHKRVARIMREDNLLAMQPRAFVVTTDSDHKLEVYLNLASRMKLCARVRRVYIRDTYKQRNRRCGNGIPLIFPSIFTFAAAAQTPLIFSVCPTNKIPIIGEKFFCAS